MGTVFSFHFIPFLGALASSDVGRILILIGFFITFIISLFVVFGRRKGNGLALFIGLILAALSLHDAFVLLMYIL